MCQESTQADIEEISREIERLIGAAPRIDSALNRPYGRIVIQTPYRGINVEVIGYGNGQPYPYVLSLQIKSDAAFCNNDDLDVRAFLRHEISSIRDQLTNPLEEGHRLFLGQNPRVCQYSPDNLARIWQLFQQDNLDLVPLDWIARLFPRDNSFEMIAARYRDAVKRQDAVLLRLSRKLLEADEMDHQISVNVTHGQYTYREHIVPCIKIHEEIIKQLYFDNASDCNIVGLLSRHMKIVHVHKNEADTMNANLRTKMPEGWTFEDSPYARLIEHSIPVRNPIEPEVLENESWLEQPLDLDLNHL